MSEEQNIDANFNNVQHMAVQKKKVILAICLVSVMVFMWGKVLFSKKPSPASVDAAIAAGADIESTSQSQEKTKISYIELPVVEGRHDVLKTDFFDTKGWKGFDAIDDIDKSNGIKVITSGDDVESERILEVMRDVHLEAIALGENPQAFISDKLVSVGEVLRQKHNDDVYELKVVAIFENKIELECNGVVISLQIAQPTESAD